MADAEDFTYIALNDYTVHVPIHYNHATTGTKTPLTAGTVTGFLATTRSKTATAAHAALSASLVHVGGNPKSTGSNVTFDSGTWQFTLDAQLGQAGADDDAKDAAALAIIEAAAAVTGQLYLIVKAPGNIRRWVQVPYKSDQPADEAP